MAAQIVKEQTPASLLAARPLFYDLLSHCIPPTVIIKTLLFDLLQTSKGNAIAAELVETAATYVALPHRLLY